MDKIRVLFLDNDSQYCSTLCILLARSTSCFAFHDLHSYFKNGCRHSAGDPAFSADCHDISAIGIEFTNTIILYNPSEYSNPPSDSHAIELTYVRNDTTLEPVDSSIYRYSSVCDFTLLLEEYISNNPQLADSLIHRNLCCVAGQACFKGRKNAVLELAAAKVREGYIPVLLEICPRHECLFHPDVSGNGNTLSDAFLRIMADDLQYNELGVYLYPADFNILNFRAFECTDDIFECSPDNIRKLVEIIRKWNEHTAFAHYIIISCHSIPFSFIYKASVLCDSLIILNMADADFNAAEYNRELSALIANLPDSCSVSRKNCTCSKEGGDHTDGFVCE
ncbi:MAG: hypothetical protein ACYCYM_05045 [Saccharofermentanales bacterium]